MENEHDLNQGAVGSQDGRRVSPSVTHQTQRPCSLVSIERDGRNFDICVVHDGGPVFISVWDQIDWIYVLDVEHEPGEDAELTARAAVEWFLRARPDIGEPVPGQ